MPDLMELERKGWDALVAGQGADFYGRLMAANAVVVVPGMVLDRQQTLTSWERVQPWADYTLSHGRTVPLGPQATLVTYEVSAIRAGDEGPYRAQLTSIYVAVDGSSSDGWQLVFHQQTPAP